jgi:hypothetical protein
VTRITRVQCGKCPVIMPDDFIAIYLHYAEDHDQDSWRPVEPVAGDDWDVAELVREFS